jgi:Ca2+-dependent lipid-binding protein
MPPAEKKVEEECKTMRVIEIYMQGIKLKNLDTKQKRDKSDCQVVLKMKWLPNQKNWQQIDHTEVIHDNLDPKWQHHFDVVFNFGQTVNLRFEVVDANADGTSELIGYHECTLAEVVKQKDS